MHYVYILNLSNGDYYTGSTYDLDRRLEEHQSGKNPSTKNFLPCRLVSYTAFESKEKAESFEAYLKTGSGVAFRNKHLI
ncbi:MAG: GIY-YIG nuclease family protein [Patescibacteria group bacterium]|nr:GIY-YIG nuclease family protein [Patescibacteria group bacterium]